MSLFEHSRRAHRADVVLYGTGALLPTAIFSAAATPEMRMRLEMRAESWAPGLFGRVSRGFRGPGVGSTERAAAQPPGGQCNGSR